MDRTNPLHVALFIISVSTLNTCYGIDINATSLPDCSEAGLPVRNEIHSAKKVTLNLRKYVGNLDMTTAT